MPCNCIRFNVIKSAQIRVLSIMTFFHTCTKITLLMLYLVCASIAFMRRSCLLLECLVTLLFLILTRGANIFIKSFMHSLLCYFFCTLDPGRHSIWRLVIDFIKFDLFLNFHRIVFPTILAIIVFTSFSRWLVELS